MSITYPAPSVPAGRHLDADVHDTGRILALIAVMVVGSVLGGGALGVLIWGPGSAISDAIALCLLVVFFVGLWAFAVAVAALVRESKPASYRLD